LAAGSGDDDARSATHEATFTSRRTAVWFTIDTMATLRLTRIA